MQRFWNIPVTMETPIVFPKPNQKPRCLAIAGPGVVGDPLMLLERLGKLGTCSPNSEPSFITEQRFFVAVLQMFTEYNVPNC